MGWVTNNIVIPVVDELLKDENLAKITAALAPAVTAGMAAQGDRIVAEITQDATQATKVIDAVTGNTQAVGNVVSQTVIGELNTVMSTLFENIKNLFPHIPGLNEPPPRPRGRR